MEKAIKLIEKAESAIQEQELSAEHLAFIDKIEGAIQRKLPSEVKYFLSNADKLGEGVSQIFNGKRPIPLSSLAGMYTNPTDRKSCLFLSTLCELSDDLIVGEDELFEHCEDLSGEEPKLNKYSDMKCIIPLLEESGRYTVLLFREN